MDDKDHHYDTIISFLGFQTYQRGEQRKILTDIMKMNKSVLIVQGPLHEGDVDVSVEINFVIPRVKLATVRDYSVWYYDQYMQYRDDDANVGIRLDAWKTVNGEPGWNEVCALKRVVLVGIANAKCVGLIESTESVEHCLVDEIIQFHETIPEALSRGLLHIGRGDLSYDFLGIVHSIDRESQLFVYGSYDERVKLKVFFF